MTPGIAERAIMASDVEAGRPQRRHANPQSRREGGRRTGGPQRRVRSGGRCARAGVASDLLHRAAAASDLLDRTSQLLTRTGMQRCRCRTRS